MIGEFLMDKPLALTVRWLHWGMRKEAFEGRVFADVKESVQGDWLLWSCFCPKTAKKTCHFVRDEFLKSRRFNRIQAKSLKTSFSSNDQYLVTNLRVSQERINELASRKIIRKINLRPGGFLLGEQGMRKKRMPHTFTNRLPTLHCLSVINDVILWHAINESQSDYTGNSCGRLEVRRRQRAMCLFTFQASEIARLKCLCFRQKTTKMHWQNRWNIIW